MDELRKGNSIILMECCQMVIYNQIGLAEITYLVCEETIAQVRGLLGSFPFGWEFKNLRLILRGAELEFC